MSRITFSIIMGNYNYGRFIREAIDSVLAQSDGDFELIVVDDGSTDDSRTAIEEYSDPRLKSVFKENGGQASAFNVGFEHSSGEVIAFLDSDDWWHPDKLKRVREWLAFLGDSCVFFQHNLAVTTAEGQNPIRHLVPSGAVIEEMRWRDSLDWLSVPTSGTCFRRAALERVMPIPESFRIAADAYLIRTVPCFGGMYSTPEVLGFYRVHDNAVFRNEAFDHWTFNIKTLIPELNDFYARHSIDLRIKPESLLSKLYDPPTSIREMLGTLAHGLLMRLGLWGVLPKLMRLVRGREAESQLLESEAYVRQGWQFWRELNRASVGGK